MPKTYPHIKAVIHTPLLAGLGLFLSLLCMTALVPQQAHADVGQTAIDAQSAFRGSVPLHWVIDMGDGFTGTLVSGKLYSDPSSSGSGNYPTELTISTYTDATYTTQVASCGMFVTGAFNTYGNTTDSTSCDGFVVNSGDFLQAIVDAGGNGSTYNVSMLGTNSNTTGWTVDTTCPPYTCNGGGLTIPYFIFVGIDAAASPPAFLATQIISTVPAPDSLVSATTTAYVGSVHYFLSGDDYSGGDAFFRLTLQQMGGSGPTGIHNLFDPPAFYTSSALEGGTASTTDFTFPLLGVGTWSAMVEFRYPTFFGLFSRQIPNTPTFAWQFDVASSTPDDKRNAQNLFRQALGNVPGVIASTTATPSYSSADCDILSATFFSCLTYLFNGQDGVVQTQVQATVNDALRRWPFGYGTIVVTALSNPNTASGTLPTLSMDLNTTGLAPLASAPTIDLSPWSVMSSSSLLSTAEDPKTHRTLREIVEPGWTGFVHLLFTLVIFVQLMGFGGAVFSHGDADGSQQASIDRRRVLNSRKR